MHALIVVSHPNTESLTHAVAAQVAQGVSESHPEHSLEIADLTSEAFDPCFNSDDISYFLGKNAAPTDVAAEHSRLDRADALVLVFPVYWWSFPGLLKGWIDRVFSNGWAYKDVDGKIEKKLEHLQVHLVGIGGADARTYERHGYTGAMKTQIDHGIFDYCGAKVITSEVFLPSDGQFPDAHFDAARAIGRDLFSAPR